MSDEMWERIADESELGDADRLSVIIDDTPALLIRDGEGFAAIEDVCTHDGQPLTDGEIVDGMIECPRHGARFDIHTGQVKCMPATEEIRTFAVQVRDDGIYARPAETEVVEHTASATADAAGNMNESASADTAGAETQSQSETADSGTTGNPFLDAPAEGAMLDSLKQVIDPELFVNIVDLGLVYDIAKADHDVVVTMTLTSPACPAGPQIVSEARSALEKMPGVHSAEIKLTMTPPWTPEMMTDDARDQLGIF